MNTHYTYQCVFLSITLLASLSQAAPVRKTDNNINGGSYCEQVTNESGETIHVCHNGLAKEAREQKAILDHQARKAKNPPNKCEIIENNDTKVLVKTEGRHSWKTLIDCVKQQNTDSSEFIPFAASPNPNLSIRQSLIHPAYTFVIEGIAHNPLHFVPKYTLDNKENDQQSFCFRIDQNDECQITLTTVIPEIYIELKKLPAQPVVHTEVLYSATDKPITDAIHTYQDLLSQKDRYSYGIYLNVVPQPSRTAAFITASHPGIALGPTFLAIGEAGMMVEYRYQNPDFNQYQFMSVPEYLGSPKQRQNWFLQMHNTDQCDPPITAKLTTESMEDYFFYERDSDSSIAYERFTVQTQKLETALLQFLDNTMVAGKYPCMRSAFYGLRVTPMDQTINPAHVVEVVTKKQTTAAEQTCLKQAKAVLIEGQ